MKFVDSTESLGYSTIHKGEEILSILSEKFMSRGEELVMMILIIILLVVSPEIHLFY